MSDHGFTSLAAVVPSQQLAARQWLPGGADPTRARRSRLFANVDWSRTRAYGLGLNGLYINLRGRERWGIVAAQERDALVDEIRRGCSATIDPETGEPP